MVDATHSKDRLAGATGPTNPGRLKGFVKYFNSYVATIFVAAIPAPISQWKVIPILDEQRGLLGVVTPLFCFLILAFLFFMRFSLAEPMFPSNNRAVAAPGHEQREMLKALVRGAWIRLWSFFPLLCIAGSFFFAARYYTTFVRVMIDLEGASSTLVKDSAALMKAHSGDDGLHALFQLPLYFILTFVLAEGAFVWMALKEYLQDVLGLSDLDLLRGGTKGSAAVKQSSMSD